MQAAGIPLSEGAAPRRAAQAPAAAAPAAGPSLESIMKDTQTLLQARDAAMQQKIADLQLQLQMKETTAGALRLEVTAAKTKGIAFQKKAEELVICTVLAVCVRRLR